MRRNTHACYTLLLAECFKCCVSRAQPVCCTAWATDAISGRGLVRAIASRLPSQFQTFGRKLLQRRTTGEPEPIMRWLVDKHNELRYRSGAQPMTWDWNLAWNAYDYVMYCPNGHSGAQGIGENLAWGHNDFNHAMRDWYDEVGLLPMITPWRKGHTAVVCTLTALLKQRRMIANSDNQYGMLLGSSCTHNWFGSTQLLVPMVPCCRSNSTTSINQVLPRTLATSVSWCGTRLSRLVVQPIFAAGSGPGSASSPQQVSRTYCLRPVICATYCCCSLGGIPCISNIRLPPC